MGPMKPTHSHLLRFIWSQYKSEITSLVSDIRTCLLFVFTIFLFFCALMSPMKFFLQQKHLIVNCQLQRVHRTQGNSKSQQRSTLANHCQIKRWKNWIKFWSDRLHFLWSHDCTNSLFVFCCLGYVFLSLFLSTTHSNTHTRTHTLLLHTL